MLKGIWFFGMSGVGKTYSSNHIFNKINNKKSILIDGDLTREYINFDSGYNIKDREIVIKRNFGLAFICIASGCFPIVCSVYMNNSIATKAIKNKIRLINITRDMNDVIKNSPVYKNDKDVVGINFHYPKFYFEVKKIKNTLDQKYIDTLNDIVDEIKSN